MLTVERQRAILERVRRTGVVTVRDTARELGAREVTVRRDLSALAARGLIERTHGGAVLPSVMSRETSKSEWLAMPESEECIAIAIEAARLVQPGDSVMLGGGSTTLALARELTELDRLTVLTNSLPIGQALMDALGVEVILTGGALRRPAMTLVGPSMEQSLHGLRATITFLSGDGLTAYHGLSTASMAAAHADRAVAGASERVVALVERSNLGRTNLWQVVSCRSIDVVITGAGPNTDEIDQIRELGVEVRTALPDPQ